MPRQLKADQPTTTAQQLGSLIKSARDIMRKDKGLSTDLDRLPMLTWIMFLKFLDDMEEIEASRARLSGQRYRPAIEPPYRWRDWAAKEDGITGPELIAFVKQDECRRRVIASVFNGVINKMTSGYLLRDVINKVSGIHFLAKEEWFTLGHLYETMLKQMRDAAGENGEFYTPRPVVRFMVRVMDAKLGEIVLDPACGTGGFLAEAFAHLETQCITVEHRRTLQNDTLFGGEEERGILANFPQDKQTAETALLFLQLIMRKLRRPGAPRGTGFQPVNPNSAGRAAVVVPNGTLFGDGVCARIKADLLREFNLHAIVRLPNGVFSPYTSIPTNLLYFDRTGPTEHVWYYEQPLPEGRKNYTKTQPMQFEEFADFLKWWPKRKENDRAWKVRGADLIKADVAGNVASVNLDIKNPRGAPDLEHLPPEQLVDDILQKERRIMDLMAEIKGVLASGVRS